MGRPELGTKCTCAGCSERFYDLNRSPAICPKCGAQQPPEKPRVLRPSRGPIGSMRLHRQPVPVIADDDAEAGSVPDAADEEAADEAEDEVEGDEVEGDIEIDPGRSEALS
jgi:uncharacterized protein (TIGR02300 family)